MLQLKRSEHSFINALRGFAVAAPIAVLLVGCGTDGGGSISAGNNNAGGITQIVAFGDSLSDGGTYSSAAAAKGISPVGKFTVNNGSAKTWVELIADDYKLPLSPAQMITGGGQSSTTGGTNYAQGGARIDQIKSTDTGVMGSAFGIYTNTPANGVGGVLPKTIGVMVPACTPAATLGVSCFEAKVGTTSPVAAIVNSAPAAIKPNGSGFIQLYDQDPTKLPNYAQTENAGPSYLVDQDAPGETGYNSSDVFTITLPNNTTVTGYVRSGTTTLPVTQQIAAYTKNGNKFTSNQLVTIMAGANDLFTLMGLLGNPATASAATTNAQAFTSDAAARYVTAINSLLSNGATKVVVGLLPDLGKTPFVQSQNNPALTTTMTTLSTLVFNATVKAAFANEAKVTIVDTQTLFNAVIAAPVTYGFNASTTYVPACKQSFASSLTMPTKLTNSALFCTPTDLVAAGADQTYIFADAVHPTTPVHQLVANQTLAQLRTKGWR